MFEWIKFAWKTVSWVIETAKYNNPTEARENSRIFSKDFHEEFCPQFWIKVKINFWEETKKKYPEIVEAINNYIETGKLSDLLPLLWVWNHQAFGLEAIWAYYYFPKNWRIVLKDDLLKPPLFWQWILAINPIVFNRNNKLESIEKRNLEIIKTLFKWIPILVYPEWTRSKDETIRGFDYKNYKAWYDIITSTQNNFSSKIAVITSDTMNVLPKTLEKTLLWMWNINPWTITYTIDIVDASLYENIRVFNKDVKKILNNNLQKEKS